MPDNVSPFEIVGAPLKVYVAPVGTTFPDVDEDEAAMDAAWENLGTQTDRNYSEEGVTVAHPEETNDFVPAGSTMPVKRFRVGESFTIGLELADISVDVYGMVMNDATVTSNNPSSGVPGRKSISLYRGDQVAVWSVVARGPSPEADDLWSQYEFTRAHMSVNGDVTWNKGVPVLLPVEIQATKYETTDVIRFVAGTAPAS